MTTTCTFLVIGNEFMLMLGAYDPLAVEYIYHATPAIAQYQFTLSHRLLRQQNSNDIF